MLIIRIKFKMVILTTYANMGNIVSNINTTYNIIFLGVIKESGKSSTIVFIFFQRINKSISILISSIIISLTCHHFIVKGSIYHSRSKIVCRTLEFYTNKFWITKTTSFYYAETIILIIRKLFVRFCSVQSHHIRSKVSYVGVIIHYNT